MQRLFFLPSSGSGRNSVHFNSDAEKRRSSRLIREKIVETGAFNSRVTLRNTIADLQNSKLHEARTTSIGDNVLRMDVNLKAEHEKTSRNQRNLPCHQGNN